MAGSSRKTTKKTNRTTRGKQTVSKTVKKGTASKNRKTPAVKNNTGAAKERTAKGSNAADVRDKRKVNKRVKDEIIAIISIALGIFFIIAFQTSAAGEIGQAFSEFFKGCFGFAAYIMPYYFIVYGILLFAKKTINAGLRSLILLLIIFLFSSDMFFHHNAHASLYGRSFTISSSM